MLSYTSLTAAVLVVDAVTLLLHPIPMGHNAMIDLFKRYVDENSWKILVADGLMIGSTVLLADYYERIPNKYVVFIGLLALYSLTYSIYTK